MGTAVEALSTRGDAGPLVNYTTTFVGTQPIAGRGIYVLCGNDSAAGASSVGSITDNQTGSPNTYSAIAQAGNAANANAQIWGCDGIAAVSVSPFIITIHHAGNSFGSGVAISIAGLTATIRDQTGTNSGASGSRSSFTATASGANGNTDEIALACIYWNASSSNVGLSDPANTGYSSIAIQQDGNSFGGFQASYKIISAPETSAASWAFTTATGGVAAAIVTLRGSAGAAPPAPGPLMFRRNQVFVNDVLAQA